MLEVYILNGSYIVSYLNGVISEYYSGNINILHKIITFQKSKHEIVDYRFNNVKFFDIVVRKEGSTTVWNPISLTQEEVIKRAEFIVPWNDL